MLVGAIERVLEMPLERLLDLDSPDQAPAALYGHLILPEPPADRPYCYVNMVATVDGKIVLGEPGGTARGLGGPTDQRLFRRLQRVADAAIIGSGTLRAGTVLYPPDIARYVVTRSGDVPLGNRFFTDAPERAYVVAPEDVPDEVRVALEARTNLVRRGRGRVDLTAALGVLRREHGVRHLLCEGGASLNADLIAAGLVDEFFLTVAAKLKGGAHLPTPVGGAGFPPGRYLPASLVSVYRDEDEIYLRYRLARADVAI
jgi:riboflavin biosynthesis pyrimidine reductase